MPGLFGTPLMNTMLFQPDLGLALIATAATGVVWAAFRLANASTRSAAGHGELA